MIKISTYAQTYELPFVEDLECSIGVYNREDGRTILRFFRGDTGLPWNSAINIDTIFSYTIGHGVLHLEPSLSVRLNGILLDIIDMFETELKRLKALRDSYNFNDAIHIVLSEKITEVIRERKIKSLIE